MSGRVVAVFICSEAGQPMQYVDSVRAIAGVGLQGDRYATSRGAFSKSGRPVIRHVTLIEGEAIVSDLARLQVVFAVRETRRNIVTWGVDLNALVGVTFMVNGVMLRGVELCEPCSRPSHLANKEGFKEAFAGRGGLRAEILSDGVISAGDHIAVP